MFWCSVAVGLQVLVAYGRNSAVLGAGKSGRSSTLIRLTWSSLGSACTARISLLSVIPSIETGPIRLGLGAVFRMVSSPVTPAGEEFVLEPIVTEPRASTFPYSAGLDWMILFAG